MKYVNLTPHPVVVRDLDGNVVTFPPSGTVARLTMDEQALPSIDGVQRIRREKQGIAGLPQSEDGTVYIVSSMVLDAVRGRSDVIAPDTGPTAIRDADGRIVAVTRWVVR